MMEDQYLEDFAAFFNEEEGDDNSAVAELADAMMELDNTLSPDVIESDVSSSDSSSTGTNEKCSPSSSSSSASASSSGENNVKDDNDDNNKDDDKDTKDDVTKSLYYYYKDFSTMEDPNPNAPVTKHGRIPSFPVKMYAILSRPDLQDIVSWMPHGRSWKVHKPREFEVKVIPAYFEHSKFSSFIRQANGWGFRRMISKGPDRNSYYHELFLRGKPHLLKMMKRPTTNKKPLADANTEPDFNKIARERPLPEMKSDAEWEGLIRRNNNAAMQQQQQIQHPAHLHQHQLQYPGPFTVNGMQMTYQVPSNPGFQYVSHPSNNMEQLQSSYNGAVVSPNPNMVQSPNTTAVMQPSSSPASASMHQHQSPMDAFAHMKSRGFLPMDAPMLPQLQRMPTQAANMQQLQQMQQPNMATTTTIQHQQPQQQQVHHHLPHPVQQIMPSSMAVVQPQQQQVQQQQQPVPITSRGFLPTDHMMMPQNSMPPAQQQQNLAPPSNTPPMEPCQAKSRGFLPMDGPMMQPPSPHHAAVAQPQAQQQQPLVPAPTQNQPPPSATTPATADMEPINLGPLLYPQQHHHEIADHYEEHDNIIHLEGFEDPFAGVSASDFWC